ncbi:peptide chain release factor N(5)-glutamine methyltransferase [Dubosiella newyorkensis]|jgi:release factor glutamine methyltransferase|uniref:Release factor glutamine methyltransferase n=3 Tax=Dubosiella newyorkensis TaxID=1862672 RepID=A0A1U7NPS7_9FIRM|nr:peptide chain release factor N(5)-glutamine methyltransferase [Dubosiella newyorkensis]MCI9040716.1 peptide chain release factor N(5)-glutamine methyltransferase [Dubosiella newyorkensis]OLU47643.1 protein-(glutamine-N5) methyltransferase, release factor-specific [Dubosiella newyorkensis]
MVTYHDLVREGKERLIQAGQGEQAAQLLMVELCSQKNINLYMVMDEPADEEIATDYLEGIHQMELGSPLGYVLGYEWFYGYPFTVNKDVLIPRPETEELVALVLQLFDTHFGDRDSVDVFDVATGSGAIGITLSLEEPRMKVVASDISKEALEVAKENNEKLHGSVEWIEGSMLEPFIERGKRCDILVCNPPYIPVHEKMEHSVVDYEPHVALFGGEDGLKFYRDVFEHAKAVLKEHAVLAFEMGYDQGERLRRLAASYFPNAKIEIHKDLSGKDRMLSIEIE